MILKTIVVGPLQCNCVILGCENTREACLIDPGDEPQRILSEVESLGLKIKYLLHTHAHFDHIGGTRVINASSGAPPCLHQADEVLYNQLPMQGKLFGFHFEAAPPIQKYLQDEEEIVIGDHRLQVLHTPGHSPGSICLKVLGNQGICFSGDTLFQNSIGRTDLWGGNSDQILLSIRRRLLTLDESTTVIPGHGPRTEIGIEKRSNPFL